jgi:hypothetical protein
MLKQKIFNLPELKTLAIVRKYAATYGPTAKTLLRDYSGLSFVGSPAKRIESPLCFDVPENFIFAVKFFA